MKEKMVLLNGLPKTCFFLRIFAKKCNVFKLLQIRENTVL